MSLTKNLKDQLASAASGRPARIQASEGNLHVVVALEDCDRLGCFLSRLDIEWVQGSMLDVDPRRIESLITYLGEKLETIETEGKKGNTILRSTPPRINGQRTCYFEMVLNPCKGLSLLRYSFDSKMGERISVPAPLTRETLERLIEDLLGVVVVGGNEVAV